MRKRLRPARSSPYNGGMSSVTQHHQHHPEPEPEPEPVAPQPAAQPTPVAAGGSGIVGTMGSIAVAAVFMMLVVTHPGEIADLMQNVVDLGYNVATSLSGGEKR